MSNPDCIVRRPPTIPGSDRTNNTAVTVKVPWHQRKLPDNWSDEEIRFFKNWTRELASLYDVLTTTAANRPKVLRRARKIYFKLGRKLDLQIRGTATQARGEDGG